MTIGLFIGRATDAYTYSKANATRAQVTTMPSRMFHPSLQKEPGCNTMPWSTI